MAVALNNGFSANLGSSGGGTTLTLSYGSVSSGSDRLLAVLVRSFSSDPSSVTYSGASLTKHATSGGMSLWYKTAQATGTNNLVFTVGTYVSLITSHVNATGVDQTTPFGTLAAGTGTSSSPASGSATLPSGGGAIWGGMWAGYSTSPGTVTAGSGTTLFGWVREGANGNRKASGYRTTTGALNFSLTNSPSWGATAVPINPAVSFKAKLPQVYSQAIQGSVI